MTVTVYHNPKSKASCAVLKALREQGHDPHVIDYMKDAPTRSDLIHLLNRTGMEPWDILREKEARDMGIRKDMRDLTQLLSLMAQNPKLLDHPIVIAGNNGMVCRSPEMLGELV